VNKKENEPCRRAIQVFSLNLLPPHDDTVEIYGMFAFRDVRNHGLRNFVFEYSRDKPCKLKPVSVPFLIVSRSYFLFIEDHT
jgi:hypothetical protein